MPSANLAALSEVDARRFWLLCIGLFLAIRVALVAIAPDSIGDASWYFYRADGIARGLGYSEKNLLTAFWPVGYPGFLGLVFTFTGTSEGWALAANLILASGSFALTVALARLFFQCELTTRMTALLLAVYPNNAAYVAILLSEVLFTSLLLLGCWLYAASRSWAGAAGAGVAIGLATLTKTQALFIPVVLVALEIISAPKPVPRGATALRSAALAAGLILTLAPWAARNYEALGTPTLATNGGTNLFYGNNPQANGFLSNNDEVDALIQYSVADQVAADKRARAYALDWIRNHPVEFLGLLPRKIWHLWAIDGEGEWSFYAGSPLYAEHEWLFRAARFANQALYAALILGSAAAAALVASGKACFPTPWAQLGYWLMAYFTLVSLLMFGHPRFHYPLMPFACIYAAWAIVQTAGMVRKSPTP